MMVKTSRTWTGTLVFLLSVSELTRGTHIYENLFMKTLVLSNTSSTWDWWVSPPVQTRISIYIFNYTDIHCLATSGEGNPNYCSSLKVQQIGPYVYKEKTEKVRIKFNDDSTITFREKKTYEFIRELSIGDPKEDRVLVPNIPYLAAVNKIGKMDIFNRIISQAALESSTSHPFIKLSPHNLLWGYNDPMFDMGKMMDFIPYDQFGLMVPKVNVSVDKITVHTGAHNISRLGTIVRFNGDSKVTYWGSDDCNQIEGSDGSQFPPPLVKPGARLTVYNHDLCRRLPFEYVSQGKTQGMPSYRFRMPDNVFDNPDFNPENACYCNKINDNYFDEELLSCLPSGVSDSSPCSYGAPILMSFPNFYLGDPTLRELFDGLDQPDAEKHECYLDIHQKFGLLLGGHFRFQVNAQVRRGNIGDIRKARNIRDKSILPVAWFDMTVGDYPSDVKNLLHHATNMMERLNEQAPDPASTLATPQLPLTQHGIPVQGETRTAMEAALAGWEAERERLLQALRNAERNIDGINSKSWFYTLNFPPLRQDPGVAHKLLPAILAGERALPDDFWIVPFLGPKIVRSSKPAVAAVPGDLYRYIFIALKSQLQK